MTDDRPQFRLDHPFCWACGIADRGRRNVSCEPDYPRWLEVHHICRGPGREHDIRNLCRLCKLCHDLAEGHTIRYQDKALPNLKLCHVLWLKNKHCSLDRQYLRTLRVKILPPVRVPPVWFRTGYTIRHVQPP